MSTELPKTYDPAAVEPEAYRVWTESKLYHAEPADPGEPYSIVIPPPNVTAALHLGHALNNTLQDILIRWHRMRGDNTCWFPGTDHAGIATQTVVEKRVMQEEGKRRADFSREEFVGKIQAWKDQYEARITDQLKRMGCSCDWDRQAFTMDEQRAKAVREAFFQLFKDGLIYRGKRLVNWDPVTQTALADDEVEMEEVDGHFYYLRYPLVDDAPQGAASVSERTSDRSLTVAAPYVTVATTRPETMLGDTAVAINPKDPRAAQLRGRKVLLPIVNREIPIIEDDYVVLPVSLGGDQNDPKAQFATGFLKVTPAHDPNDYDIGQRHALPMVNVMAPDGSISDKHGWSDVGDAGFLLGKDRFEARKLVVQWFKEHGLLEDMKPYRHTVGHSYRSHVPIEPYLSDQWYCRVTDPRLAGAALRAMAPDQYDPDSRDAEMSRDRKGAETSPPNPKSEPQPPKGSKPVPLAYLITFTTYGTWLHGDARGSADRDHNVFGTFYLIGDESRERQEFESLKHPPVSLDEPHRQVVRDAIAEVCAHRGWALHVAHVRPTHVHAVISADASPERVMNDFKAYATRRLREAGLSGPEDRIWTRHGSTRYLFDRRAMESASEYVHDRQGVALEPGPLVGSDANRERNGSRDGAKSRDREGAENPSAEHQQSRLEERTGTPLPYGRGSFSDHDADWQGQLRFYPARYAKTFQTWHGNIRDWCISRQLWWGHRIPVWSYIGPSGFDDRAAKASQVARMKQLKEWLETKRDLGEIAFVREIGGTGQLPTFDWDLIGGTWHVCPRRDEPLLIQALEEAGFRQDPDVLDTWFSSGLWPLSTMNWPNESEISDLKSALNVWNPTDVLCTAREIITLWVSRMVMFNLYFLNRLPFTDVFIHAMIQDGHGQKMSKSLGNGVDPNDIIHSHGADAMRFTLASMATNTQDVRMPVDMVDPHSGETFTPQYVTDSAGHKVAAPVQESPKDPKKKMVSSYGVASGKAQPTHEMPRARNTSSKFDLGRNFCNKLWNAARFAMMNLASTPTSRDREGAEAEPTTAEAPLADTRGSLADRWIVSRFNRAVADSEASLREYRFDQYAKTCYDFFWRDFCDWYLEVIKPAMKDPARAPQTAKVLAAVLDGSLRLMHPMIPFITEKIWDALNAVRPERGLPGKIMGCTSPWLIKAAWPRGGSFSDEDERVFGNLQEIVSAIRTLRNDYKVDPRRSVTVSIRSASDLTDDIRANAEMIELLGTCTLKAAAPDLPEPPNAARASAAGCEIFIEGMVDPEAEKQRVAKLREDLTRQINALKGRLNNEGYISKAPPHLVQQTRDQLAQAEAELAKLG